MGGLVALASGAASGREVVPPETTQLVVATAADWNADAGRMQLFERSAGEWKAVSPAWTVLFGRAGLAWGRGLHPPIEGTADGPRKVERDRRAPAGLFRIGLIYTYDAALPAGADFPFHTVTAADAWVDDPKHPLYNRHVRVDPADPPGWFARQRMRLGDPPHRWLVEIRHNADPVVPGAGSAIFFHLWRGPARTSAGCTVMSQPDLLQLIRWLRADRHPCYLLLPQETYRRVWKAWGLPAPEPAAALLAP